MMLRPAINYKETVYIGTVGECHMDVLAAHDVPIADDIHFEAGFVTPEDQFLNRQESLLWLKDHAPAVYRNYKEAGRKVNPAHPSAKHYLNYELESLAYYDAAGIYQGVTGGGVMEDNYGYRSRMQGALIGFMAGDALGATTEFMAPEQIKEEIGIHSEITGGGWLDLEAGETTDDTAMMLCVAEELTENGLIDPVSLMRRFTAWYDTLPSDVGSTCRSGILRFRHYGTVTAMPSDLAAGNGALMRALPVALAFAGNAAVMAEQMKLQAHATHNNPRSDLACACYGELIENIIAGKDMQALLDLVEAGYPEYRVATHDGNAGGYVVDSMNTVLHCFFTTDTFEEALIKCVNLGGDADTTGAILGGVAGSYYGIAEVPSRWREKLNPSAIEAAMRFIREVLMQ